jgi:hypothetical protein
LFPKRYTRLRLWFCLLGAILLSIPQTLLFFADKLPPSDVSPLEAWLSGPLTGLVLGWIVWRIWAEHGDDVKAAGAPLILAPMDTEACPTATYPPGIRCGGDEKTSCKIYRSRSLYVP